MRLDDILKAKGDDGLREWFEANKEVRIEIVKKGNAKIVEINGEKIELDYKDFFEKLHTWVNGVNRLHFIAKEELSNVFPIKKLKVDLVDLSGITLKNKLSGLRKFLYECVVNEVVLPTYPEEIVNLVGIVENSKIEKPIDLKRALGNTNILDVGPIFARTKMKVVDLSELDFSHVVDLDGLFYYSFVEKIILPKNIAKSRLSVRADNAFFSDSIKEIVNLEYFPFDKLTSAECMFNSVSDVEIVINSKLERLKYSLQMFGNIENARLVFPNLERIPDSSDWFYGIRNCEVHLPKLKEIDEDDLKDIREIDDSNELFLNQEFARKLRKG